MATKRKVVHDAPSKGEELAVAFSRKMPDDARLAIASALYHATPPKNGRPTKEQSDEFEASVMVMFGWTRRRFMQADAAMGKKIKAQADKISKAVDDAVKPMGGRRV